MSTASEETDVIRALHATARPVAEGWPGALARLAALLRATSAWLQIDADGQRQVWHLGPDPVLPPPDTLHHLRPGRVYARDDLPGTPPPGPALRILRMPLPEGSLTLAISRQGPDFRAADSAQIDRLAPHLQAAAETWSQLRHERAAANRTSALARALGGSWLVFDTAARVIEADATARRLLPLTADKSLDIPQSRALRAAVEAATSADPRPGLLTLNRAPLLQLAVLPQGTGRALGLLRAAPQAADLPPSALAALGLTRAEARLATLLADGDSLTSAAAKLGWSVETARSTSKQIFARLGLDGQGALLRLIHSGALWLADGAAHRA